MLKRMDLVALQEPLINVSGAAVLLLQHRIYSAAAQVIESNIGSYHFGTRSQTEPRVNMENCNQAQSQCSLWNLFAVLRVT